MLDDLETARARLEALNLQARSTAGAIEKTFQIKRIDATSPEGQTLGTNIESLIALAMKFPEKALMQGQDDHNAEVMKWAFQWIACAHEAAIRKNGPESGAQDTPRFENAAALEQQALANFRNLLQIEQTEFGLYAALTRAALDSTNAKNAGDVPRQEAAATWLRHRLTETEEISVVTTFLEWAKSSVTSKDNALSFSPLVQAVLKDFQPGEPGDPRPSQSLAELDT